MSDELRAALRNLRESVCQENGVEGMVYFDSYRGPWCPTCSPQWDDGAHYYQHEHDCALAAVLALAEALPDSA